MTFMILIGQLFILFGGWLLYLYLKRLPETIHEKSIKSFEFQLNSKLEEIKASLTKEIELLKISQAELQVHKTQEFVKFVELFNEGMSDPKNFSELMKNPVEVKKFNKTLMDLGVKLFFFASDPTVKKFVELRKYLLQPKHLVALNEFLILYAELIVLIRKDLGYKNSECNIDDFLNIIVRDWEQHKQTMSKTLGR